MNPFGRAEKKQNAAAAPDAIKVNALGLSVPTAPSAPGGGKKVNGDFVLRPKLMSNPVSIGRNTASIKSVKKQKLILYKRGLAFYWTRKKNYAGY